MTPGNSTNTGPAQSYVQESNQTSATWWNGPSGTAMRFGMSVIWDGLQAAVMSSVLARFPIDPFGTFTGKVGGQLAPNDALPWIGSDRQITQGYLEPNLSYAQREVQYLDRWAYAGKPTGVLMAVIGWFLPQINVPSMEIVTNSSRWFWYTSEIDPFPPGTQGAIHVIPPLFTIGSTIPGHNGRWNWDGLTANWWRSWLVIFISLEFEALDWGTTGKKWGDPSVCWGFNAPSNIGQGVKNLVKQWKAGHEKIFVLYSFSSTLFTSYEPDDGVHNPAGNFGSWAVFSGGGWVGNRFTNAVYAGWVT
jgi:hypothetical protein